MRADRQRPALDLFPIVVDVKLVQHAMQDRREHESTTAISASPLWSAYIEAKIFAALPLIVSTGPMPPRIIDALSSESIQASPAR